ncbi:type I-E CRISPR-associated protein Cse1/CasA [Streptomyces sp. NPDC057654]|uniref:type I-E CRISPR-associated protein Cse1/CasA n=1 Tax=Streptomyces sp. NPDC057654 TaxID=3346196 RepID=UPI003673D476
MLSFPLTTRPWIPVHDREAGTFREVGMAEALLRAHHLSLTNDVQEGPVLLRVLAATYDAAAGPATYEEWAAAWQAPTLDTTRITAYLHQWEHRLDLFHPDEPAFQSGALTQYARDARVLHPSYLGGDAGRWFNHVLYEKEGDFPAYEAPEAARNLLVLTAYDVAGIKRAVPGDPAEKQGKVYGAQLGHVAQLAHVHICGGTLKDTLLLNLPPQPRRDGDAPVWERPTPAAPMAIREPTGRLDMLTWPSRRIRLHADRDGKVDLVAWHDGDRMTDAWQQPMQFDPMSMWRTTKTGRWAPSTPIDRDGLIVPWQVAHVVLDPTGDESGQPLHCAAARHLAHVLDQGLLADYGPLRAEASRVQHSNQHKSVIADVPSAPVTLATGEYLTDSENRADLAATARTATAYLHRLRLIIREIAPPHTNLVDRMDFRVLYDRWRQAASLLASNPVEGRKQWRFMLREQAAEMIDSLPLNTLAKGRALAEAMDALTTTRFVGEASRAAREWKQTTAKNPKKPRTGRPTNRTLTAFGETKSLAQWAKDPRCQVSYPALRARAAALLESDDAEHIITTPAAHGPRTALPKPEPTPAVQPPPAKRCVNCGQPRPKDAIHSRCEECRAKRVSQDWLHRKEIAEAIFTEDKRTELLRRLASGESLAEACTALDLTPHRVHGFTNYNDEWRGQLDTALTDGRDPGLDHGTETAYRHGGCRCPDCRAAHDALRGTGR